MTTSLPLTLEQGTALDLMEDFLHNPAQTFFVLAGYAGTGKTYCLRQLAENFRGRLIFTAPTNKATKVLRDVLTTEQYKPECRTIYSLLGLRLEANGEVKVLAHPEDPVDLTKYKAIIVDEASMVNSALLKLIREVATAQKIKFIFVGDPAQLPPVKEALSPVWVIGDSRAELLHVMRQDNQILTLATALRKQIGHPTPRFLTKDDNAEGEGVWQVSREDFERRIMADAEAGLFSRPSHAKAIAWRNVTVDKLNTLIRAKLFDNASQERWLPDDRVILTEPARTLDDEPLASTDDEGVITHIDTGQHPRYDAFKVYNIHITFDDNRTGVLRVLHEDSFRDHAAHAEALAVAARAEPRKWCLFWQFQESFHKIRHAYAITAHRAQGSTYDTAYVDWRDILTSPNRAEAFRCLYVACTRPKKRLILG